MNYTNIIKKLQKELSFKNALGPILDSIMFNKLEEFSRNINCNKNLLYMGAIIADIRIDEAITIGDINLHIDLALEYFDEIATQNDIPHKDHLVISEIIKTHHGGEQKFIESKIFKNADNFKFLETKGCLHFFGAVYTNHTVEGIREAVEVTKSKIKEKLELTDFNSDVIRDAKRLYDFDMEILDKILIEY